MSIDDSPLPAELDQAIAADIDTYDILLHLPTEKGATAAEDLIEDIVRAVVKLDDRHGILLVQPFHLSSDQVDAALSHDDISEGVSEFEDDAFAPVDFGREAIAAVQAIEDRIDADFLGGDQVIRAELVVTTPEGKTSTVVEYDVPENGAYRRVVLGTAIGDVVRGVRGTLALDEMPTQDSASAQDGARFNGMRIEDMARTEVNVVLYHDPEADITPAAMCEALSVLSHIQLVSPAA
jgi:hypothetical protein